MLINLNPPKKNKDLCR